MEVTGTHSTRLVLKLDGNYSYQSVSVAKIPPDLVFRKIPPDFRSDVN